MESSLPVAERPRRPEWMKVRAPSADSRYFDVKKLLHGLVAAHRLRGGALPQHRRVLGPRHRDLPDPRRHVHARVPLLLRPLRQAGRAARPARAAPRRPGRRADGAASTSSSRRSTATTCPDRGAGHFAATIRAHQGEAAGGERRGADARLPRRRGGGAPRPCSPLDPRSSTTTSRPCAACTGGCAARRRATTRRSGCSRARRSSRDYPVLTKSGIIVGLGETNDEIVETMRDLRAHGVDVVTIGQYLQPSAEARDDRPLGAPRRVPLAARAGRGARLRLGLRRPARALELPRGRAAPRGRDRPRRGRA